MSDLTCAACWTISSDLTCAACWTISCCAVAVPVELVEDTGGEEHGAYPLHPPTPHFPCRRHCYVVWPLQKHCEQRLADSIHSWRASHDSSLNFGQVGTGCSPLQKKHCTGRLLSLAVRWSLAFDGRSHDGDDGHLAVSESAAIFHRRHQRARRAMWRTS